MNFRIRWRMPDPPLDNDGIDRTLGVRECEWDWNDTDDCGENSCGEERRHSAPALRQFSNHSPIIGAALTMRVSLHGVFCNYLLVPLRTEFGRPLLGGEIDVVQAEALAVAVGPLEVVHQAPEKISLDGIAF